MGIFPVSWTKADDPMAKDPFADAKAVRQMWKGGGTLTHGRLKENIDKPAGKDLKLADPRKLRSKGKVGKSGIGIRDFFYDKGGYSAGRGFPKKLMRPPTVPAGSSVLFTNFDALVDQALTDQVWHSITSCKAPCNRGAGIGYPLANGPIKFDSGQLGFGTGPSRGVTTGTDTFETPPLTKRGKTYTYFCRIHPFMRGSVRVAGKKKKSGNKSAAADSSGVIASGALPG
jgi:plastocyanin